MRGLHFSLRHSMSLQWELTSFQQGLDDLSSFNMNMHGSPVEMIVAKGATVVSRINGSNIGTEFTKELANVSSIESDKY